MIAALTGSAAADGVFETTGGVGYDVRCVNPLPAGEQVRLLVCTTVNRDGLTQLWGFNDVDQQNVFRALTAVSGVGPSMAMSVLRSVGVAKLALAVRSQDAALLKGIPGVGAATVRKIISLVQLPADLKETSEQIGAPADVRQQVIASLTALGYPRGSVESAVERAAATAVTRPDLMQSALRELVAEKESA